MSNGLNHAGLREVGLMEDTNIYGLPLRQSPNRFFIVSSPLARKLLAFPEVIGWDSCNALLSGTVAALRHFSKTGLSGDSVDILTILRGGLNYPVEQACRVCGIPVREIHFISCERVIEDHVITGLDVKYEKVRPSRDRTILIGDIIATGDTLRLCLEHVIRKFHAGGGSIRRIIFFTIGGTRAVSLMDDLTLKIKALFPKFEGFDCFFFEGMFSVYTDKGVSGINVPDIDFGWKDGVVSPEFRNFIVRENPDALFEKCIIYDGGARRYEIPAHFEEVLEYWEGIRERAAIIDPVALVAEKLGYPEPVPYDQWLDITGFRNLERDFFHLLWATEQDLFQRAGGISLESLAKRRINSLKSIYKRYE